MLDGSFSVIVAFPDGREKLFGQSSSSLSGLSVARHPELDDRRVLTDDAAHAHSSPRGPFTAMKKYTAVNGVINATLMAFSVEARLKPVL
jgi:hypothetical protein